MDDYEYNYRPNAYAKPSYSSYGVGGGGVQRPWTPDPPPLPPPPARRHPKPSSSSSSGGGWGFNDAEMKRRRRVASYKAYSVEGKVKTSLRKGLRWIKIKCSELVHGW